ncbi:MAG: hypothetical protein F9B45_22130 [Phycisphaera sp. RhM]|nr:hypothetical protein [Phycisphaera sp. RhM]
MKAEQDAYLLSQPVIDHLKVDGLVEKILAKFDIVSLGDLCELDLNVVAREKGVGTKKIATLQNLISNAQDITSYKPTNPRSSVAEEIDSGSPLLFVPSLIKEGFRHLNIDTVEKLLSLQADDLSMLPFWGGKKSNAAISLRKLYETVLMSNSIDDQSALGAVVPIEVMPDRSLGELTIAEFRLGAGGTNLKGKAVQETADLRAFFRSRFSRTEHWQAASKTDWREVPLQVNSRVQDFLDKHGIRLIRDIEKLAACASIDLADGRGRISALEEENFGESSLANLRNEVAVLKSLGLHQYRSRIICEHEALDCEEMDWEKVPLRIRPKTRKLLASCNARTVADVHRIALRSQVPVDEKDNWKSVGEFDGFTQAIVDELRREVNRLGKLGLSGYRFGEQGRPANCDEFIARVRSQLDSRYTFVLQDFFGGKTLEQVGCIHGVSKERVRQIVSNSLKKIAGFEDAARGLLLPALQMLDNRLYVTRSEIASAIGCTSDWEVGLLIAASHTDCYEHDGDVYSQFTKKAIADIVRLLKSISSSENAEGFYRLNTVADLIARASNDLNLQAAAGRLHPFAERHFPPETVRQLLGSDWIRSYVRSQLVAAGVNGISYEKIDTGGLIQSADELAKVLGSDAEKLDGGIFRRSGSVYARADEIVSIIRKAKVPVDTNYIMARSKRRWHQSVLVGNYLSPLYEIVNTGRGKYIHIDKLGFSRLDVQAIADWGADLLAGERKTIDGEELFDLFQTAGFGKTLDNPAQLVSIVAKHRDIRRLSNNLQLAHRDSFDESSLSLESVDPEIASQWHPSKNGNVTPADVRPNSFKPRWWRCEKGHEFEAMPVYRTRMIRTCPGCQERWNLEKIRHFVGSLRKHLDAFTPAELYVIFQQSGLLNRGGRAKGFVKSLATGRFPKEELDKFVAGDESLVDDFISDDELDLESLDTLLSSDDDAIFESGTSNEGCHDERLEPKLPRVSAKSALDAMDCPVIASTDGEAVEFLVASAKAKIWSHAFRDENAALTEVKSTVNTEYANRVKSEFCREYAEALSLDTPPGYAFTINGKATPPNLMQRHVAVEVRNRNRFGNWSGTGAGKTLSAVLATRVCDASLSIVCCPNAVVGTETSGWRGEIQRIFPDSDVAFKTWTPSWSAESKRRYLVMNYEQFQQPDSERRLKRFLDKNRIDFVVIDEVHYAKQRYADQMSQRKRLLQALVVEAGKKNDRLRVLGLSATPVINNLQEGRSLIEILTGIEHDDLPTKATVPNCMRLHQHLATLGTRWLPEYESILKVETPEIDCSDLLEKIHLLGTNPSPLEIEKILTLARLPLILDAVKRPGRSLLYSHYIGGIDHVLYDAISDEGFRCGFYTGESKDGLQPFKDGQLDVLIGSSAIGTGVDGLQHACDRLIVNSLPWTNAEFEQLIGRIWRQGQQSAKVEVVVPITFADVGGERWSYCRTKLDRIRYKKSIADAAVDGSVPEGNLRTPAQAQKDLLEWLKRLESGNEQTIERRMIVVPLSEGGAGAKRRLARYGDFSTMNSRWNRISSANLAETLKTNPEEWEQYHTLYRRARENWSVVPFKEVVRWLESREGYVVADFGCGEAFVSMAVGDRHIVHSFDHVAITDSVIACDISKTPLDSESVDVAVFCLSLMGSNFISYLREANRVLKIDGHIHVWESESRFDDVQRFANDLERLGFQIFKPKLKGQFVHLEGRKTEAAPDAQLTLRFRLEQS